MLITTQITSLSQIWSRNCYLIMISDLPSENTSGLFSCTQKCSKRTKTWCSVHIRTYCLLNWFLLILRQNRSLFSQRNHVVCVMSKATYSFMSPLDNRFHKIFFLGNIVYFFAFSSRLLRGSMAGGILLLKIHTCQVYAEPLATQPKCFHLIIYIKEKTLFEEFAMELILLSFARNELIALIMVC